MNDWWSTNKTTCKNIEKEMAVVVVVVVVDVVEMAVEVVMIEEERKPKVCLAVFDKHFANATSCST